MDLAVRNAAAPVVVQVAPERPERSQRRLPERPAVRPRRSWRADAPPVRRERSRDFNDWDERDEQIVSEFGEIHRKIGSRD
jgi:hypothetical protein